MPDLTFRQFQKSFRELGLTRHSAVMAHASLSAFGRVHGGAATLVGALCAEVGLVVMPTFTYQCLIHPRFGPPNNGLTYGDFFEKNAEAEIFRADLPAHADMGAVPEALRLMPGAVRSTHPVLSFTGLGEGAAEVMAAQTLADPFAPIAKLAERGGDVLLLGVGHAVNTSLHYAEKLAGRKQFVRWALTPSGVVECPAWPGDSAGFEAIGPYAAPFVRATQIGSARVQRLPLRHLLRAAEDLLHTVPEALLCAFPTCERCNSIRASL